MKEHGTNSRYASGCRCESCAAAHREYSRVMRALAIEKRNAERLQRVCVIDGCALTVWSANAKVTLCADHNTEKKRQQARDRRPHNCRECGATISRPRARLCDDCRAANQRRNKRQGSRRELLAKYGMTPEGYDDLLQQQGGRCYGCGIHADEYGRSFHIDHDHACCSGVGGCEDCIRGLACGQCNAGWGMLAENLQIAENMHRMNVLVRRRRELRQLLRGAA